MNNLIEDLSTLTTITRSALEKLVLNSQRCIGHSVLENFLNKEPLTSIDIGIGTLYVKLEGDMVKYKFTPSKELDETICHTIINKQSPIVSTLEHTLKERIENTYKELL